MGGHGSFTDLRPPIGLDITQSPDQVTPKLPALLQYQLSLQTPQAPSGSFRKSAARRGVLSDPPLPFLHSPSEVGQELEYASRSVTGKYRTTPLRALWQHPPYFHDGSAKDLPAVVNHYNTLRSLGLTERQKADLVEFLKML